MKPFFLILFSLLFTLSLYAQDYKQVRVHLTNPSEDMKVLAAGQFDLEHSALEGKQSIVLFMSDAEFKKFTALGFRYDLLIDSWFTYYKERQQMTAKEKQIALSDSKALFGVQSFGYGSMGGYYTLDEVIAQLDSMRLKFPGLISQKTQIGKSVQGRPIYAVHISKTPDVNGTQPQILYTALHHAREPEGMMALIYYMYYLLENYNTNASIKYLVDNREMWFIPVVNPDGYEYNRSTNPTGGGMWRKNRTKNADTTYGIDLNRNYGPNAYWNSSNNGSSTLTSDDTYRGTAPFSEPETQAIRDFVATKKFRIALNYHTYSNLVIIPYGALPHETPDSVTYREYGGIMVAANGYTLGRDIDAVGYSTRGNSDDYMYDGDTVHNGKILALTTEIGASTDGFWPAQARILPLAQENLKPNLFLAWVTGDYTNLAQCTFNKKYYNAGDTVSISVAVKNRGLSTAKNLTIQVSPLGNNTSLTPTQSTLDSISARTTVQLPKPITFTLSKSTPVPSKISLVVSSLINQTLIASDTVTFNVGQPTFVFFDSANVITKYWTVTASPSTPKWDTTRATYVSAPSSYTDSKSGTYSANATVTMTMSNQVSLVGLSNPRLTFKTKYDLESSWDCGVLQVSSDNGTSWAYLTGQYTKAGSGQGKQTPAGIPVYDGQKTDWVTEDIDLSAYAGKQVRLKFELRSDEAVNKDGWYLDDIGIYSYAGLTGLPATQSAIPTQFTLEQNYPNPFNPETTIHYALPEAEYVTLTIYDALGRQVAQLVNERQQAGSYSVRFAPERNRASGVYFYRLTSGLNTAVKKMIYMK